MSKKTTSTILDGNHVFPAFYACYLLRSRASVNSNRTYVGSTPNPPKRIRQHNGELTQGAKTTSRYRPWEMQLIVHGRVSSMFCAYGSFPSKLTALQFEWAWQKPELSRHLRVDDTHMFKKDAKRNWLQRKILVARVLLSVPPFSNLPLHVRFFNADAQEIFQSCQSMAKLVIGTPLPSIPETTTYVLDLGGVLGSAGQRDIDTPGVTSTDGPIDVKDAALTHRVWRQWTDLSSASCAMCTDVINTEDHLSYATCPSDCPAAYHLVCIAKQSTSLLPKTVKCICHATLEWGEIVKSCYARRVAVETEKVRVTRPGRRHIDRSSLRSSTTSPEASESEEEWRQIEQEMMSVR